MPGHAVLLTVMVAPEPEVQESRAFPGPQRAWAGKTITVGANSTMDAISMAAILLFLSIRIFLQTNSML